MLKQSGITVNLFQEKTIIAGGGMIDDGVETEYINEKSSVNEGPAKPEASINISKPEVREVTQNSATIKGTILSDYKLAERGVCYSDYENPTILDNPTKVSSEVVNVSLKDLYEGTTYYVRLYAVYDGEIYYGDQISFTTNGKRLYNIALTQTIWSPYKVKIEAELPNEVDKYGLCWGTNPHPKITDEYIEEKSRKTSWTISVSPNANYYLRAYHINGSTIEYFDDSEIEIQSLGCENGSSIELERISGGYINTSKEKAYAQCGGTYLCKYNNLPSGTYQAMFAAEWSGSTNSVGWSDLPRPKLSEYVEESDGSIDFKFNSNYYIVGYDYIYVIFSCIETGHIYYVPYLCGKSPVSFNTSKSAKIPTWYF